MEQIDFFEARIELLKTMKEKLGTNELSPSEISPMMDDILFGPTLTSKVSKKLAKDCPSPAPQEIEAWEKAISS